MAHAAQVGTTTRTVQRMSDEEIRGFLAGLPADETGQPDGYIAIFRHTIDEHGGDLTEIDGWMHRAGAISKMAQAPPRLRSGARPEFVPYYQVPLAALADPE